VATTGTSEFVKRWNPKPGDIVSFRHSGFLHASKKPKSAALYRLRPELSWDDVGNSFKEQKPREKSGRNTIPISRVCLLQVCVISQSVLPWKLKDTAHDHYRPKGFWRDSKNWRAFFLEVAEGMGFDPFIPENWDSVKSSDIRNKVHP